MSFDRSNFIPFTNAKKINECDGKILWVDSQIPAWLTANKTESLILELANGKYYIGEINDCLKKELDINKQETMDDVWKKLFFLGMLSGKCPEKEACINRYSKPQVLFIEITNACWLDCEYCYYKSLKTSGHLKTEYILKAIDDFCQLGGKAVKLSGGEPFLHPDIKKIVRYCYDKGVGITILSSLYNLDDVSKKIISDFPVMLQISLDSHRKTTHDKLRGDGSFEKTVNNIRWIADNIPNKQIRCATTLWKGNISEGLDLIEFGKELGIRDYHFSYYKPLNSNNGITTASVGEILQHELNLFKNLKIYKNMGIKISGSIAQWVYSALSNNNRKALCSILRQIKITPAGDIYACAQLSSSNFRLGNINEDNLVDILKRKDDIEGIRFYQKKARKAFMGCSECIWRKLCRGGCIAWRNENNNKIDCNNEYFCEVRKELFKIIPFLID